MAQVLELIIRAKDEASRNLDKVKSSMDSMKVAAGVITSAALAYSAAVKAAGDLAKDYMTYAIAAGDFAEKTGMATEEASALLEVVQDMGVDLGSLELAFRTMSRQGIDPSIDGLIEVKTRLAAAGSDAERMALAMELMGRSGSDLIPILAQLSDAQLRGLVGNLSDAQTVTDEEYQKMLQLRMEVETFNDSLATAKLLGGEWIITNLGITKALERLNSVLSGTVSYWAALLNMLGLDAPSPGTTNPNPPGKGGSMTPGQTAPPPPPGSEGSHPGGGGQFMGDSSAREIRRLVDQLPTMIADAVEKVRR